MPERNELSSRRHLATFLHHARKNAGLTQKQAAELLRVDPSQISRWERGTHLPSISRLRDIASTYHVDYDELLNLVVLASSEEASDLRRELSDVRQQRDELLAYLAECVARIEVVASRIEAATSEDGTHNPRSSAGPVRPVAGVPVSSGRVRDSG